MDRCGIFSESSENLGEMKEKGDSGGRYTVGKLQKRRHTNLLAVTEISATSSLWVVRKTMWCEPCQVLNAIFFSVVPFY